MKDLKKYFLNIKSDYHIFDHLSLITSTDNFNNQRYEELRNQMQDITKNYVKVTSIRKKENILDKFFIPKRVNDRILRYKIIFKKDFEYFDINTFFLPTVLTTSSTISFDLISVQPLDPPSDFFFFY